MKPVWLGWAAVLGAVGIYAGNFVVNRYGIKVAIGANDIVALRVGIAGIILLPLLWHQGIRNLAGIGWKRGVLLTITAGPPFILLMVWGLSFAPVAHGAPIVSGMIPISTALAMWYVTGQRIPNLRLAMFGIVIIGLALVSGFSASGDPKILFGDFLFFLSGSCWGFYAVLLRKWQLDPIKVTSVVSVLSLLYLPVYFLFLGSGMGNANFETILFIGFYQGILGSIVALVLFSYAVNILGAGLASLGNATVPVFAALLAVPVLGELPTTLQWVGIAMVVGGVICAVRVPDLPVKVTSLEAA